MKQHKYIPGLDGLRAFAVAAVILYHCAPNVFPGGFLGVDIFFVLSGFLITTLLLRELKANGKIDLCGFWIRRLRRLVPAFTVLILTVVPLAAVLSTDLLVGIGRQVLGALTFSTNWLEIAHGTSYFDTTAPLLFKNFWSLAIEEQFYLIWPLLLLLLLTLGLRARVRIAAVAVLAGLSMLAMGFFWNGENATRVYYGTDTHLFGLALGVVLAFLRLRSRGGFFSALPYRMYFGPAALAVTAVGFLFLPDRGAFAYRGGIQFFTVSAAILLAAVADGNSFLTKICESAPLRWAGTRSYGLYLWHWPVLVLAAAAFPVAVGSGGYWVRSVLALALTVLICELSYRFVETPVRRRGFRQCAAVFLKENPLSYLRKIILCVCVVLFALTATAVVCAPAKTKTQILIEKADKPEIGKTRKAAQPAPNYRQLSENLDTSVPKNEEITVIGDSIYSAGRTGLEWAMPGVKIIAKPCLQWKAAPEIVAQALREGKVGRVAVIGYGTNAGITDPQDVHKVIRALGRNRMILLQNLYSPSGFVDSSNKKLEEIARGYANVRIIDWHSAAAANPAVLQVDQTHTSIKGANMLGRLIHESVLAMAKELTAQKTKAKAKSGK